MVEVVRVMVRLTSPEKLAGRCATSLVVLMRALCSAQLCHIRLLRSTHCLLGLTFSESYSK